MSSFTLQQTTNYASQCVRGQPLTGVLGIANEPAFTIGNWVRQFILSAPFAWSWNRSTFNFQTVEGTQDYSFVNYALESQTIGASPWVTGAGFNIVTNAASDPQDGLTASVITPISTTNAFVLQTINNLPQCDTCTFSIYLASSFSMTIPAFILGVGPGAFGGSLGSTSWSITAGPNYQRFSFTIPVFPGQFVTGISLGVGGPGSGIPVGQSFYAWGAQLETNNTANPYLATTTLPNSAIIDFGYMGQSSIADNKGGQWELNIDLNQGQATTQGRPRSIAPYISFNSNVQYPSFRLLPVPDDNALNESYTVNFNYQKQAPVFQNLTDTWAPIPDYYYYLVQTGFLAKTYEYTNDERFPQTMSLFVKQVLAANAGLADTQDNIFLQEYINTNREVQNQLGNSASGRAARGLSNG